MQSPQPSISGTRDYAGEDAVALQAARDAIDATLRRYAYAAIDPPILESSSPFLNRSGEDIRRHMYIFPDPGGREVCLRPELTIPVCRAYLRQLQAAGAERGTPARETRLCYFGPAFRYESTTDGRYRQFYQAGAELIGARWKDAADAEILAVALDSLDAAGLKQTAIQIGDVEVRNAFIDNLKVSERSKTRIRRMMLRDQKQPRFVEAAAAQDEATNGSDFGELATLLAAAEPGKAELLIREVFALADVRHVGERSPEEIIERLISRTAQQAAEPISAELIKGVQDLLSIRGKPDKAFNAIREHFRAFGIASIDPVLEQCESRLRCFNAYRPDQPALEFNVGLRRGLEYYTGFLFEIYAKGSAQVGHVCGGGRYDNLLEGLGASTTVPAVGFGIGLDRLLLALQGQSDASTTLAPQALVVVTGKTPREDGIGVAAALREAGWAVELDSSGSDEQNALRYAAKRKIAHVVFADRQTLKKGEVRVRRPNDRTDQVMTWASLRAMAANARAGKTADGKS